MDAYVRAPGARDDRGRSPDLWSMLGGCPIAQIQNDFYRGSKEESDFTEGDEAVAQNWTLTQATSGTAASNTGLTHGNLTLDAGATTATQGPQIQLTSFVVKPEADKAIYFECHLQFTSGVSNLNVEFFAGLAESDTTVIASSAVSTANHIGFSSVTDDGVILANAEKAGTGQTSALGSGVTVAAATYYHMGFVVEGVDNIYWFWNGARQSNVEDTITSTHLPIVDLIPTFVVQSGGTDRPVVDIDWWSCYFVDYGDPE